MSNDMHPDLKFLAENVSEWGGTYTYNYIFRSRDFNEPDYSVYKEDGDLEPSFSKDEWLQARQDLGLAMTEEEQEIPAEEWKGKAPNTQEKYSAYYKDVRHIDYIDVYRTVDLFGCEKHGHPISHAAKKLLLSGSRTGGKDVEEDVREAIDTLCRWLEMREEDRASALRAKEFGE